MSEWKVDCRAQDCSPIAPFRTFLCSYWAGCVCGGGGAAGVDWRGVPRRSVARPVGLLTAPRPCGGARGPETPLRKCVSWAGLLQGTVGSCSPCSHRVLEVWGSRGGAGHGGTPAQSTVCCCQGCVCLVPQALAGRLGCLTLSLPGEVWAWACNLHVTRTSRPTAPRLPAGTGRAVVRGTTGVRPALLDCHPAPGGAATWAGSFSPRPGAYSAQVEGPQGAQSAACKLQPAAALQPA